MSQISSGIISNHFPQHILDALLRQEKSVSYNILRARFEKNQVKNLDEILKKGALVSAKLYNYDTIGFSRNEACAWCYRIVDYFKVDREVVGMAMNYLDRILCIRQNLLQQDKNCKTADEQLPKKTKQAASRTTLVACLHIAITLSPSQQSYHFHNKPWYEIIYASCGIVQSSDIVTEETKILFELQFKLYPPSVLSFIKAIVPENAFMDPFLEEVHYFAELTVLNDIFVGYKASSLAFTILMSTLEMVEKCSIVAMDTKDQSKVSIRFCDYEQIKKSLSAFEYSLDQMEILATKIHFQPFLENRFGDRIVAPEKNFKVRFEDYENLKTSQPISPRSILEYNKSEPVKRRKVSHGI